MTPAVAQPTTIGKEIHRLAIFDGHLYPAFGDYDANTGPITAVSVDLATQILGSSEASLTTEETWTLHVAGGKLYVPFIDPQSIGDPSTGQYAVATATGAWTTRTNVTPEPIHVFDVAETTDGLWLFGSDSAHACIWRSTDGGDTWAASFQSEPASDVDRAYRAWQIGDELIAFVVGVHPQIQRWDGSTWTDISSGTTGSATPPADGVGFTLDGVPFFAGVAFWKAPGNAQASVLTVCLRPEDEASRAAIEAALPTGSFYDAAADGTDFYLVGADGQVHHGTDAGVWTSVLTLNDLTVRSIAVDQAAGFFYFGTTDSRIIRTPIPA